ncbi:LytTR family transcriptional regulator DNA-binding domain-containing protein [Wenyingzhuangia sp. IMCC45574]
MIKEFIAWCNKPYYLIDNLSVKLSMVLGVGVFTYLFLLVFQPYGIHEVITANPFLIVGYGILVSFSLFITYFILPKIFPFIFSVKSWTVKKEALFLLVSFLIISTTNYFYHTAYVAHYMPKFSFLRFVAVVLSIGVFPVFFIIFMVERHLFRKHNVPTKSVIENIRKEKKVIVSIPSDNIKEPPLELDIDTIFYAQSNNNYTTVYYLNDHKLKKELIRITLKKVAVILEQYPQFVRCHRSFLVNKYEISKVEGNARTLQVYFKQIEDVVPVSRSFPKEQLIN